MKKENKINWAEEINCNKVELFFRRKYTALFYSNIYRKLYPNSPWLTPGAVQYLKKFINSSKIIFEYGSGLSTLWFVKNSKHVLSVENDINWYQRIEKLLDDYDNKELIYVEVSGNDYSKYEDIINNIPQNKFDIILIDGRSRINCLKNCLGKITNGGIIILDDSQRPRYSEAYEILSKYPYHDYNFGIKRTTIWEITPAKADGRGG